jgi:hypothetical protein
VAQSFQALGLELARVPLPVSGLPTGDTNRRDGIVCKIVWQSSPADLAGLDWRWHEHFYAAAHGSLF